MSDLSGLILNAASFEMPNSHVWLWIWHLDTSDHLFIFKSVMCEENPVAIAHLFLTARRGNGRFSLWLNKERIFSADFFPPFKQ